MMNDEDGAVSLEKFWRNSGTLNFLTVPTEESKMKMGGNVLCFFSTLLLLLNHGEWTSHGGLINTSNTAKVFPRRY